MVSMSIGLDVQRVSTALNDDGRVSFDCFGMGPCLYREAVIARLDGNRGVALDRFRVFSRLDGECAVTAYNGLRIVVLHGGAHVVLGMDGDLLVPLARIH